ncbi:hypothetical protein vseg_008085 [Gypsophila vaccaria]
MEKHQDDDDVHPCSSSSSTDSNSNNNNNNNNLPHFRRDDTNNSSSIASCSSSSFSSNNNSNVYYCYSSKDLSTDLRLGLSISSIFCTPNDLPSTPRGQYSDWPPIKPLLRNTLAGKKSNSRHNDSLFVKVYMEGIPIGRKLNLLAHHGYHSLVSTLSHMFHTTILFQEMICHTSSFEENHILTYEDKEGDWMMVGDVPWELFLTTVTRLKIALMDKT